ncbi:unnamed protein product [Schistosoma mattheei]|uniref:Uncharacterized protein n=1 Tax=Schistosoma mattheei TaxID=31246 RepID=A0A183PBY4_9TREM|nr:unnamed protein product [Schistosoma mattheei]
MKDAVDAQFRDQQDGFRKDQTCTDQIATLRSSPNNQLSGTRHYTSTSLIMKRRLTFLKLPDSSSSNSSSSNNTSTSSSCSNHILKYNRELTDELDLNNQNTERFDLMHNLNNENNNNMNEHHHHFAYNTYIKRRNSENYEHSKLLYNNNSNNNNAIPSTTGNQLFNVSETIGNHCHITISKRRDNATITNLQSINNNSNCTKITSTTPFSSSFRDSNTMNQLLTRLNSIPTTHYSRPDQSRNIIRTHSCSRGKSRYYSHGSASVPDPASPVRS